MSELLRISIAPMVVRLKEYIETAQENLGKSLADQSVRADLIAERNNLSRAISLLEKYNGKWEAIFARVKGQALQEEEQNYREYKPEGKPFMEWVDQARGLVDTIEGALGLSQLGEAIPQQNQPAQAVQHQTVHPRHDVTLPPITLPKFSGEPREWPLFWKLFESSVESLQIEDFKKHIYLLGCLPDRSVARRAIDLYPPSDENYPRVVEILKKRFGDEKSMVESLQAELLHLPKPSESVQSLRNFSESIERICHQLLDFGENEQNKFMASTIKSKLPYQLLTQVVEKELMAGGAFSCTELRKAITSIVEVKEEVQRCTQVFRGEEKPRNFSHSQSGRRHQPGRGTLFRFSQQSHPNRPWRPMDQNETAREMSPQPNLSFSAINQQYPPQEKGSNRICSLCCTKGHAPSRCSRYTTPGARRKRLADQDRCINCLITGHYSNNCNSPNRCSNCGKKHHFMVCFNMEKAREGNSRSRTNNQAKKKEDNRSSQNHQPAHGSELVREFLTEGEKSPIITNVMTSVVAKKPHAYLMTRRVMVTSENDRRVWREVPILFDPGSQSSYISDSLIKRLNPPKVTSEEMEVYGFGGERNGPLRFHSPVFSILIRRMDDKWEELLLRTERISTPFKMAEWNSEEFPSKEGNVPQALSFSRDEPEILIGARHFWQFFQGKNEVSPGLFVIQTTLGPLVNGESDSSPSVSNPGLSMGAIDKSNQETAIELFSKPIRRKRGGRNTVWPRKEEVPDLPSNYRMASSRLMLSTMSKLQNAPDFLEQYDATIKDQSSKGIIKEARKVPSTLKHYKPHQSILAKGKKLRIGYDARAPIRGKKHKKFGKRARKAVVPRPVSRIFPFESSHKDSRKEHLLKKEVKPNKCPAPKLEQRHRMAIRSKARMAAAAISLFIIMLLLGIFTTPSLSYPMDKCDECHIMCAPKGIHMVTPAEVRKVELCCAENYYIHKNVCKLTYELPKEILVNNYQCQAHFWLDSKHMFKKDISCPPIDECTLIECYLCLEQLANPTCHPLVSAMLTGGLCLSFMSMCIMLYFMAKLLWAGLRICLWIIRHFSFSLQGTLHYVPHIQQEDFGPKRSEKLQNSNQPEWLDINFDWKITFWSLMGFQTVLIICLMIVGGIICLTIFIKFSPFYRLWKTISWSVAKKGYGRINTVIMILYLAGGGSFGCGGVGSRPIPSLRKFSLKGEEFSFYSQNILILPIFQMPIPFREKPPFFSAPIISPPVSAEIFNDRLFDDRAEHFQNGDGRERDGAARAPREHGHPYLRFQTERLSSWIERSHGRWWYETAQYRRRAEEDLRGELRDGALLYEAHLGPFAEILFDGFSVNGPADTEIFPGRSVLQHFQRLGFQVNPRLPCLQEYGGFNPPRGIHVHHVPIDMVNIHFPDEDVLEEIGMDPPGRPPSPDGRFENRPQRRVPNRPRPRWPNVLYIVAIILVLAQETCESFTPKSVGFTVLSDFINRSENFAWEKPGNFPWHGTIMPSTRNDGKRTQTSNRTVGIYPWSICTQEGSSKLHVLHWFIYCWTSCVSSDERNKKTRRLQKEGWKEGTELGFSPLGPGECRQKATSINKYFILLICFV